MMDSSSIDLERILSADEGIIQEDGVNKEKLNSNSN